MIVAARLALAMLSGLGACDAAPERSADWTIAGAAVDATQPTEARLRDAAAILAEIERSGLSTDQRVAVEDLQLALREMTRIPRLRGSPRYARVDRGPANLRAAPSLDGRIVAVLDAGTVVDVRGTADSWRRVEVINAPAIRAGYIHADLLEAALPEDGGWENGRDGLDPALAGFSETFSSSDSFKCLDDLKLCKQRHGWFDCELVMIVCIGEAFIGSFK